ncbi:IS30 family transposase [Teredinibacter waterburyi]|uniref:IS30 family transposase n=1 Tax=Teredinibacter waterburyi TaxID=1500538 RepID=UPI00165ECE37|nr:IS30 family transposase [Teredinibacter waterburyi]
MNYTQLTSEERYTFSTMRTQGQSMTSIANALGRHRATLYRELQRNRCHHIDNAYRPSKADYRAKARRCKLRRYSHFTEANYVPVNYLIREKWSPEQIAGILPSLGFRSISHETIYKYIWADKANGGNLWIHLRQSLKQRRKRYKAYDSRGRLANKRNISERPTSIETRKYRGHWEIDTVMGKGSNDCIVTLVERKSGFVLIGKLPDRTTASLNTKTISLMKKSPAKFKTITADNGTEFHQYNKIEEATGRLFYFANPYHSWERGSNENCNGLIRQYIPKGSSMASLTQQQCNRIADKLNARPRKRHNFKTPADILYGN